MTGLNIPIPAQQLDFDLPSVRHVTFELVQLLGDSDVDMDELVAVIKLDPALTGRIICYANSPFQAPLQPITTLENAVIRTGRNELKKIFYRTVIRDAFARVNRESEHVMQMIWLHSLAASLAMDKLCLALQDYLELDDEEYSFLSTLGILHNIGFLVLHHNFKKEFNDFFLKNQSVGLEGFLLAEQSAFHGVDHCLAGKYLLDRWYFPPFLGQAVLNCFDPVKAQPSNPLIILLRVSNYLALQTGLSFFPNTPPGFWLRGLPDSWDLEPVEAIAPVLAREVRMHQNILSQR